MLKPSLAILYLLPRFLLLHFWCRDFTLAFFTPAISVSPYRHLAEAASTSLTPAVVIKYEKLNRPEPTQANDSSESPQ